jgi:hypothetical protein
MKIKVTIKITVSRAIITLFAACITVKSIGSTKVEFFRKTPKTETKVFIQME